MEVVVSNLNTFFFTANHFSYNIKIIAIDRVLYGNPSYPSLCFSISCPLFIRDDE